MTALSDLQWVARARAGDEASPVITGINVDQGGKRIAATDKHRLHICTNPVVSDLVLTDGLYTYDTKGHSLGEAIDGRYPNFDMILPDVAPNFEIIEVRQLRALGLAAATFARHAKTSPAHVPVILDLPGLTKPFLINGQYLADALDADTTIALPLAIPGLRMEEHLPMLIGHPTWRQALIMPIRNGSGGFGGAFDYRFTVPEEWIGPLKLDTVTTQSRGRVAKNTKPALPAAKTPDRIDVQAMRVSLGLQGIEAQA